MAKQLAFVFGLPLLFLFALLLVISRPLDLQTVAAQAKFTLLIAAVIAGLLAFVVVVLLRGRTETRYTVDAEGVKEETAGFLRYMNVVKALLLLSGRPSAMGAGLMAQGPTSTSVPWQRVDGFVSDPVARTVTLNRGGREEMVVRCMADNYDDVLRRVEEAGGARNREGPQRRKRPGEGGRQGS